MTSDEQSNDEVKRQISYRDIIYLILRTSSLVIVLSIIFPFPQMVTHTSFLLILPGQPE